MEQGSLSAHPLHAYLLCGRDLCREGISRAALRGRDHHVRVRACLYDGRLVDPMPTFLFGCPCLRVCLNTQDPQRVGFFLAPAKERHTCLKNGSLAPENWLLWLGFLRGEMRSSSWQVHGLLHDVPGPFSNQVSLMSVFCL